MKKLLFTLPLFLVIACAQQEKASEPTNGFGPYEGQSVYLGDQATVEAFKKAGHLKEILIKEGIFVAKVFIGTSFNEIVADAKIIFKEVRVFKPKSSRKESKESFIICKKLR